MLDKPASQLTEQQLQSFLLELQTETNEELKKENAKLKKELDFVWSIPDIHDHIETLKDDGWDYNLDENGQPITPCPTTSQ